MRHTILWSFIGASTGYGMGKINNLHLNSTLMLTALFTGCGFVRGYTGNDIVTSIVKYGLNYCQKPFQIDDTDLLPSTFNEKGQL